jgi:hypothetical protein
MKSITNESDSDYELGVAYAGLCNEEGCSWEILDGSLKWLCCCNQHLCNAGFPIPTNTTTVITSTITSSSSTSTSGTSTSGTSTLKSTILILISALMFVIIPDKNIKLLSFISRDLSLVDQK